MSERSWSVVSVDSRGNAKHTFRASKLPSPRDGSAGRTRHERVLGEGPRGREDCAGDLPGSRALRLAR